MKKRATRIVHLFGYFCLACACLFIFRGPIFRTLIHYSETGTRKHINIDDAQLIENIEASIGDPNMTFEQLVKLSSKLTNDRLSFTFLAASRDPNQVYQSKKANCIGYAALFNSILNFIIEKKKLNETYQVQHLIGKLDLLGFDLHNLSDDAFFKEHDFIRIKNKKTGKDLFVDPSIGDYLLIDYVNAK